MNKSKLLKTIIVKILLGQKTKKQTAPTIQILPLPLMLIIKTGVKS